MKPEKRERTVMLLDCQSFYASVEHAAHPEYDGMPLVVAGDPKRRSGIILAACPIAKSYGVITAERLGEAYGKCPHLVVVQPRMQAYIDESIHITEIYESFSDLVEPYSIDEQFVDVTGSLHLFGSAEEIARQMQKRVKTDTGVYVRAGIGANKVLAKMACDNFAKKNKDGIFTLRREDLADILWPLRVDKMFGVGSRMLRHFTKLGLHTIGDIARMDLLDFKRKLRILFGRNADIQAEVIWRTANGLDDSPVVRAVNDEQKGIGHMMTLPRDYARRDEIEVVLLELCELVCQRCRQKGYMGRTVSAGVLGADFDRQSGFSRQMTLDDPTNIADEMFAAARKLLHKHWNGQPVRRVGVSLTELVKDDTYQLVLFGDRERKMKLDRAMDDIKERFGNHAIMRAASITDAGQARDRSRKIGGHYK